MDFVSTLRSWHLVNAGNGINGEFFGKVADELERLTDENQRLQEELGRVRAERDAAYQKGREDMGEELSQVEIAECHL